MSRHRVALAYKGDAAASRARPPKQGRATSWETGEDLASSWDGTTSKPGRRPVVLPTSKVA